MTVKTTAEQPKTNVEDLDMDVILSEIGQQGRVAVSRLEPDWCKGHVRTVQIQNEPLTMEWITQNFGGTKLILRIYGPKGLKTTRQIEICGAPRDGYGVEVVRGPDGEPVPVTRLQEVRRRYNLTHGLGLDIERPDPPPPPAQNFDLSAVLQTMIQSQNSQNQTMIGMLVNRIASLETLLHNRPDSVPAQQIQQIDPLNSLKSTVDTIAQLEKIKEAMGISDRDREPESETGIYTSLIKGFMDLELEKRRAQVEQIRAQAQEQPQPTPPALPEPPRNHAVPQGPQVPQGPPAWPPPAAPPQDAQKAADDEKQQEELDGLDPSMVQDALQRVEKLSRKERLQLASLVLGEPIDDGEDDNFDEYEDEDENDTAELENQFTGGQDAKNLLDLAYTDETGDDTDLGENSEECSEPTKPPIPPHRSAS